MTFAVGNVMRYIIIIINQYAVTIVRLLSLLLRLFTQQLLPPPPPPTVLVDQSPNVDRVGRSMSLGDTLIARHPVGGTGVLSTAEPPPT